MGTHGNARLVLVPSSSLALTIQAGFSTWALAELKLGEPVATTSTGLIPRSFLMSYGANLQHRAGPMQENFLRVRSAACHWIYIIAE